MSFYQKLLLLCSFICLYTAVEAQASFKPGVRTGLNFTRISNTSTTHETRVRYYAGLYGNLRLSKIYALQFELNYSRQGAKSLGAPPEINLNYFGINFTNQFYLTDGFYAMISPGIDFEINSDDSNNQGGIWLLTETFSGLDFALSFGAGYTFPFGLGVELRYKQGLLQRDIFSDSSFDGYYNNSYNSVIQLGITYTIGKPYEAN